MLDIGKKFVNQIQLSHRTFGTFLFFFNLIIAGNYLGTLFPCRIQNMFNENPTFQHFIAYFTMYFFITNAERSNISPWQGLTLTSFVYGFFLIAKNSDFHYYFIALLIFVGIALADIFYDYYKDKKDVNPIGKKIINKIPTGIKWGSQIAIFVILLGFIIYIGKKKDEYGDNFNVLKFFFNSNKCNFNQMSENKTEVEYFVRGVKTLVGMK